MKNETKAPMYIFQFFDLAKMEWVETECVDQESAECLMAGYSPYLWVSQASIYPKFEEITMAQKSAEILREELVNTWESKMSLGELIDFYREKTQEYLDNETDADILVMAEEEGLDINYGTESDENIDIQIDQISHINE